MRTRLFITLLCALLCGNTLQAQITHTAQGSVDANAQKILDKAAKLYKDGVMGFQVTVINKDSNKKKVSSHKAEVTYAKGNYKAVIGEQTILCDGKAVYTINKETNEVMVNNMSERDDDLMNPGRLLANWQKSFRAKYIRTEENGDAVVDMTPRNAASYHKIRLVIGSNGRLKRMTMHNYDASEVVFELSDYVLAKVPSGSYTFDPADYPGMEVIDMR